MTSKTFFGVVVGFVLAASPFIAPLAFAAVTTATNAVTTSTVTAPTATVTAVVQSAPKIQVTLRAQIALLLQQVKALQVQIARIKTNQQTITKTFVTLRNQMRKGSRGKNVRVLQRLLASDPLVYPQGLVTGYYGSLTEKAVKKFQEDHGISPVGEVGPETRMLMNSFLKRATSTISMNFLREVEGEQRSATSTERTVIVCHRTGGSGIDVSERVARRALFSRIKRGDRIGRCESEDGQGRIGSRRELRSGIRGLLRGERRDSGERRDRSERSRYNSTSRVGNSTLDVSASSTSSTQGE